MVINLEIVESILKRNVHGIMLINEANFLIKSNKGKVSLILISLIHLNMQFESYSKVKGFFIL